MTLRAASGLFLGTCLLITGATVRTPLAATPADVVAEETGVIDFQVFAPVLGPITSLVADLSSLPPGHTAVFTASPDNTSGTFHWSPEPGSEGVFVISFATTKGAGTITEYTTLSIVPSGTSALIRNKYVVSCFAEFGFPASYDLVFGASDDAGTSGLDVPVSWTNADGCPDAALHSNRDPVLNAATLAREEGQERTVVVSGKDLKATQVRARFHQEVVAVAPTLSAWGNFAGSEGYINCAPFVIPIDFIVEARSTAPESDLSISNEPFPCSLDYSSVTHYTRDPRLSAPGSAQGSITLPLNIYVDANDPDGEPIAILAADLSGLPAGNDAVFTASPDHAHGTLTWTPAVADSGDYSVSFRAANRFTATRTTSVHVHGYDVTAVPVGAHPIFSAFVWPNPLGPDSRLQLVTTRPGPVRMRLFDAHGRLTRELLSESNVDPGKHEFPLAMEDGQGHRLLSGIYFYRVEGAEGVLMGRVAVLR